MPSVLLLESIHPTTNVQFTQNGWSVRSFQRALSEQELILEYTQEPFQFIGIRSKTHLTKSTLQQLPELLAVGCFCIGTDQVDLHAATELGIAVFNSPFTSSRSVAELVIGYIISLYRRFTYHNNNAHIGTWSKTAKNSHEIQGKVLGIIGYGHIGTQLSVLAEGLGLKVIFYDILTKMPLANARACTTMQELLAEADIVTLHVPKTPETTNLIGDPEIALMKPNAILINASRGSVVDIHALENALIENRIAGAAVDVYPIEPKKNGPFQCNLAGFENVILTPHIGGATEEAQERIAIDVSNKLHTYASLGGTRGCVNLPELNPRTLKQLPRVVHIHHNKPGTISAVNKIIGKAGYNICGELLSTNDSIGYTIIGLDSPLTNEIITYLENVPGTIRVLNIL